MFRMRTCSKCCENNLGAIGALGRLVLAVEFFDCLLLLFLDDLLSYPSENNSYPIDPVGGHMLYPGILAMQV